MGILQKKSEGTQDTHLSLIQYLRKNNPELVVVETEVVTVEGGTFTFGGETFTMNDKTFEEERLSLRVRSEESTNDAMGKARYAAQPWLQENSNWTGGD